MSEFKAIVPEATTNLVTNPSLEIDTTGWTAVGGSMARSTAQSRYGVASLAVTPTAGTADGCYYGTVSTTSGQSYTMSVRVKGVLGVPYRIYFGSTAGAVLGTPTEFTGTGDWQEVEVTWAENSTTTRRLYIVKNNSGSTGVFYVDGLQCENKAYATTYCDGSLVGNRDDGYLWSGAKHASTSVRHSQERSGGRVRDMVTDLLASAVNSFAGGGAPEHRHNTDPLALLPGELYQNTKIGPRFVDLGLTFTGSTIAAMHANRKAFYDAIRLNRVSPRQPFVFRYAGGARTLEIDALYAGGLDQKPLNKTTEKLPLRLFCPQPYWRALGERSKALTVQQSITGIKLVARRGADGAWSALGPPDPAGGIYGDVRAVAEDGTYVYWAGNFQNFDNIANADWIVRYHKATGAWSALATGANNPVRALAIGPDGSLYAGGDFTSMAGVANTARIAKWNPVSETWSALGTGMNGAVHGLAFGPDGSLYATGDFTTAGGTAANRVAKWNGSAWSALGTGLNVIGYALAVAPDGTLYAGGEFITAGGVTVNYIAKWNGSAWSSLAGGMNNFVRALAIGPDGRLYAGGVFTTAGGITVNYIAIWNGSAWVDMAGGMDGTVNALKFGPDNVLYAGGSFVTAGGISMPDRVARWSDGGWTPLDADLPGAAVVRAILPSNYADPASATYALYLGFDTTGDGVAGAVTTVANSGTADSHPKLTINGPGRLYNLINYTTGATIYFDLTLLSGEQAVLDLDPQRVTFESTFRGNIITKIINGSDVAEWFLQPGDNAVSLFVDNASATAFLTWPELYEAADG